ncbi:type IV-A pilus assembly ATPase PilB [Vibrio maerlii]|uniref:type IV-A pilus assembly ATPase PilB n=1 Tax=Vibrio maerlii TaxID=2231648 RepID=UPI000E3D30FC|nr:type IV-A pilus assembly ATPase PilB [Vibrio maerlii]
MLTNLPTILRQAELISLAQEEAIITQVQRSGKNVPEAILDLGLLSSFDLTEQLSVIFGLPNTDLSRYRYEELCTSLGVRDLILRYQALPLSENDACLVIAVSDPTHLQVEDDFRFATGKQVELALANIKDLQAAIRRLYGQQVDQQENSGKEISHQELAELVDISREEFVESEDLSQDDAPVSRFINQVLLDAVSKNASDIHFEPYEDFYRIRLRCDGILVETQRPAYQLSRRLSARIKILSKLDIAERRLPQDGRIKLRLNIDTAIDIRVSTLPTLWGEKIVLRILDSSTASLNIDALGYTEQQKDLYLHALKQPQGMILMTGPTGSGKTISLYAGLSILNTAEINISTAEDPVEINLSGINQVQVQPKIGFGFAEALRSFLRQDPDVVMVGEIRDIETAEIAVKAAQTGHLVLSTLHTNSAAETLLRLDNMGIEAYNLASSLSLIIAQRLVRRLCPFCKYPDALASLTRESLMIAEDDLIFKANPQGCNECTHGYSGRVGIYEVMPFTTELAQGLMNGATVAELNKIAKARGMLTLKQSGIEKLKQGITSYAELQRVLYF